MGAFSVIVKLHCRHGGRLTPALCRRFGGFPVTHDSWARQLDALEADLMAGRHRYQRGSYYTVGYNNPWQLAHR